VTKEALTTADNIILPTYTDHFQRAEIIRHNLLDNLNNFVVDAFTTIIANQIVDGYQHVANAPGLPNDPHVIFMINRMDDFPLFFGGEALQRARTETFQQRKDRAVGKTENKMEAIKEYFNEATTYVNDPQNVHDNKVNKDLKRIYDKIAVHGYTREELVSQMTTYINTQPQSALALATLQKMLEGHPFPTLNATEDEIVCAVWARSLHPDNVDNASNIQNSIYLALVDCWEHDTLVCQNGRIAKVMGSLSLVDNDPDVLVINDQTYRNQIYKEVVDIVDDEVNAALESDDPDVQAAGQSYYEDAEITPEITLLKDRIKDRIDQNIATYTNFTAQEQANIKAECYVAACL
jgi:hypothetical protein